MMNRTATPATKVATSPIPASLKPFAWKRSYQPKDMAPSHRSAANVSHTMAKSQRAPSKPGSSSSGLALLMPRNLSLNSTVLPSQPSIVNSRHHRFPHSSALLHRHQLSRFLRDVFAADLELLDQFPRRARVP